MYWFTMYKCANGNCTDLFQKAGLRTSRDISIILYTSVNFLTQSQILSFQISSWIVEIDGFRFLRDSIVTLIFNSIQNAVTKHLLCTQHYSVFFIFKEVKIWFLLFLTTAVLFLKVFWRKLT